MSELFIGLMSGTSMDGIDAALVEFQEDDKPVLKATHSLPFPGDLRALFLSIQQQQRVDIHALLDGDVQLGELYATAALQLMSPSIRNKIRAIGCHGQTLWHRPKSSTCRFPSSWQIGDPNIIAERTGITTVADFRRRDMAAGGEGAPLVSAFHQAVFQHPKENRAILNLGGIANLTLLKGSEVIHAFDTGPGNALMDAWVERQQGAPMDRDGAWAKSGQPHPALLRCMLDDPYFLLAPPKSTGREYFHLRWLNEKRATFANISDEDIQATLCELTALSITQAMDALAFQPDTLIACGGGVNNAYLIERLAHHTPCPVRPSSDFGIAPQWVEAMAFAWLAKQRLQGHCGNLPTTTGATHPVILGAIYAEQPPP